MKKTIIITGSSSGLGYALAKKLSKKYNIIGCGRRKLKTSFQKYYHLDLNNPKEVEDWSNELIKKKLNLFALINNASAIPVQHPALLYDLDLLKSVANINMISQILIMKNFSKFFVKNKKKNGRIINISSMASPLNENGTSLYASSKQFIEKFVSIFSKELSKAHITCNTIGFTYFNSPSFKELNQKVLKKSFEKTNIQRPLKIDEVIHAVNFLLDKKSNVISGQKIFLGMSI